jgi:hypothetical protein
MNFSPISAFSIWNLAARTLTGFGGAFVPQTLINQSLAANATFGFSPAANQVKVLSIGAQADATGTVTILFTDGTNTWTAVTVAAGTVGGIDHSLSTLTCGWQVHNNSATVAAHYFAAGYTAVV